MVERYNDRNEVDILKGEIFEDFTNEILDMIKEIKDEPKSHDKMGITIEEKAIFDILQSLTIRYEFNYPYEKLITLSKKIKEIIDDKIHYVDWYARDNIKAELQFELVVLLDKYGYPPVTHDEAYNNILKQAKNFKRIENHINIEN